MSQMLPRINFTVVLQLFEIATLASTDSVATMKSQALFDAMSAAVKAKGPELVKLGGAAARTILDLARFGLDPGVGRDTVSCSYSAEVFQFVINDAGPEGKFVLDLKNGSGSAKAGEESSAAGNLARLNLRSRHAQHDCTIIMADADLVSMAEGKLDGMQAFMGGKLKIKGNMMLAQKLASILEAAK
ncbi:SCP2 [Symbiodinium natans]|uniref:SCP2 protein n=1 Tax=Symbiodinium natans TaxID=878477 RepID=A0A812JBJ3_9DINO|nr:SCP2 [Symbiodinium natans]